MRKDVRRPREFDEMLRLLCQSEDSVFDSYKDALVFSACLGFSQGRRTAFDKSSEPIGAHIFRGEFDLSLIHCLGIATTGDPSIMSGDREAERVQIFEEYACGGLEVISREIMNSPEGIEIAIERLVTSAYSKEKTSILEDITGLS